MKSVRRFAALLLCGAMTLTALAACGGETAPAAADNGTTAAGAAAEETAEEVTTAVSDDVPELDFDGAEFRIASSQNSFYYGQAERSELNGDVLNDAMYMRNREAERRFNVTITEFSDKADPVLAAVRKTITAGDTGYHVMMIADRMTFNFALEGYLTEYGDVPYVDLTKPYWPQYANGNMTISGKLYGAFGDFSLPGLDYTHVLAFNMEMQQSYGLTSPYDAVDSDSWTLDLYTEMAKSVLNDVNGDGVWGMEDTYGHVASPGLIFPTFWIACDVQTVRKNADGMPYFAAPGDEKLVSVYETICRIMYDDGIWYAKTENSNVYYVNTPLFENGQSLFADRTFFTVSQLRDMETDFGIVPYPKWNESQDDYHSWVEGGCQTISVPINTPDMEESGALLEALCAISYNDVIPAYYEISLKQKYTRDPQAAAMFDVIRTSRTFDLGDTFWFAVIRAKLGELFPKRGDLSSYIASSSAAVDETIAKSLAFFE